MAIERERERDVDDDITTGPHVGLSFKDERLIRTRTLLARLTLDLYRRSEQPGFFSSCCRSNDKSSGRSFTEPGVYSLMRPSEPGNGAKRQVGETGFSIQKGQI